MKTGKSTQWTTLHRGYGEKACTFPHARPPAVLVGTSVRRWRVQCGVLLLDCATTVFMLRCQEVVKEFKGPWHFPSNTSSALITCVCTLTQSWTFCQVVLDLEKETSRVDLKINNTEIKVIGLTRTAWKKLLTDRILKALINLYRYSEGLDRNWDDYIKYISSASGSKNIIVPLNKLLPGKVFTISQTVNSQVVAFGARSLFWYLQDSFLDRVKDGLCTRWVRGFREWFSV